MSPTGTPPFAVSGDSYDQFMGRYSERLAAPFARWVGASPGMEALDVGCGTGALTGALINKLGARHVAALDPAPEFVTATRQRFPGLDVRRGTVEDIPFDGPFGLVTAQLVLHFVAEPVGALREMARVVRPGGTVAVNVWDAWGMDLLLHISDACAIVVPGSPDVIGPLRFGRPGELNDLFGDAGFADHQEVSLTVTASYRDFDELWAGLQNGMGPAAGYLITLAPDVQLAIRDELHQLVGAPEGPFHLDAVARCGRGTVEPETQAA